MLIEDAHSVAQHESDKMFIKQTLGGMIAII